MPEPSILVHSCTTAGQLLELLSPLDQTLWPDGRFIFRGQPSADFPLEASAHRLFGRITASGQFGSKDVFVRQQIAFEAILLRDFLEGCDRSGLVVPGDGVEVRRIVEHLIPQFIVQPKQWPPEPLHQVLAVAQHHGVPTCLLDWTHRSYVAAYFAASSALSLEKPPRHVAIWALDTSQRGNWKELGLVQLPGGTSSNLAAQRGLFTISRIRQETDDTFVPLPLNEHNPYSHGVSLIKYTLPFSEAIPLLKGCHRLGVSGSTLFPGYEGVAKEVQDIANMGKRDFDSSIISAREL